MHPHILLLIISLYIISGALVIILGLMSFSTSLVLVVFGLLAWVLLPVGLCTLLFSVVLLVLGIVLAAIAIALFAIVFLKARSLSAEYKERAGSDPVELLNSTEFQIFPGGGGHIGVIFYEGSPTFAKRYAEGQLVINGEEAGPISLEQPFFAIIPLEVGKHTLCYRPNGEDNLYSLTEGFSTKGNSHNYKEGVFFWKLRSSLGKAFIELNKEKNPDIINAVQGLLSPA